MQKNLTSRIIDLYLDGFRNLSQLGKKLWIIILIKLFVFFVLLRLIFFPGFLESRFETDRQRGNHVLEQLVK